MAPTPLPLPARLDTGLTRALLVLLRWSLLGSLWLFGLLLLAVQPIGIAPYSEGVSEISLLEAGFCLLMLLLLWRHIRYCRHFKTGFWHGLNRMLISQGAMFAFTLLVIGLLTSALVHTDYIQPFLLSLRQYSPVSECLYDASILLALYLAAPTAGTKLRPHNVESTVGGSAAPADSDVRGATEEASR